MCLFSALPSSCDLAYPSIHIFSYLACKDRNPTSLTVLPNDVNHTVTSFSTHQIQNVTSEMQLNETKLAVSISAMAQAGEMSGNKILLLFCRCILKLPSIKFSIVCHCIHWRLWKGIN